MQQPVDVLAHADIAARLEAVSVKRAALPLRSLLILGLLGGVYIGFGGALATLALTDSQLGFGPAKLAAGGAFSLGLILLVIAGGELFTGNNLMLAALASGKVSARSLWRNWTITYAANAAGALLLASMIHYSGVLDGGGVKATAVRIAEAKAQLGVGSAFLRGLLCNVLVCLAVWLSLAARSIEGKVLAIVFPITAFVALGFEHCVANLYLIPVGMLSGAHVTGQQFIGNILAVTLGNTVGGGALASAYWLALLRDGSATAAAFRIWRMKKAGALRVACKVLRLAPRAR
jgi:formate transporter